MSIEATMPEERAPEEQRIAHKLLYPAAFLSMFPLYVVLVFGLHVASWLAILLTVGTLTLTLFGVELARGVYGPTRRANRKPMLDVYYGVMGVVMSTLTAAVYTPLGAFVGARVGIHGLWDRLGTFGQCVLAIVLVDFLAYVIHRAQHAREHSILWRSHAVHHAVPMLDVIAGAQVHVLDGMVSALPVFVLAVLGFSPEVIGAAFAMNLTSAGLHHTDLPTDLGWFNYLTIAPETHRWHHADATESTVNYGFVFAIWDIVFGTFHYEGKTRPPAYGARSVEVFPDSLAGHLLVGTTARAYRRLVKRASAPIAGVANAEAGTP